MQEKINTHTHIYNKEMSNRRDTQSEPLVFTHICVHIHPYTQTHI